MPVCQLAALITAPDRPPDGLQWKPNASSGMSPRSYGCVVSQDLLQLGTHQGASSSVETGVMQ